MKEKKSLPNFRRRLREIVKDRDIRVSDIARALGKNVDRFNSATSGRNRIDMDLARQIADFVDIPIESLIAEPGSPIPRPGQTESAIAGNFVPSAIETVIPVYKCAAATLGHPPSFESTEGFQWNQEAPTLCHKPRALDSEPIVIGFSIEGSSMEPVFPNGSRVLAAPQRQAQTGAYCIAEIVVGENRVHILKRYQGIKDNHHVFEQLNPSATIRIPIRFVASINHVFTYDELF